MGTEVVLALLQVLTTACLAAMLSIGLHKVAYGYKQRKEQKELQETDREQLTDVLADAIEDRWLQLCEVDPVQRWLQEADRRVLDEAAERARCRVLRPYDPPVPQAGQVWALSVKVEWHPVFYFASVVVYEFRSNIVHYTYAVDLERKSVHVGVFMKNFVFLSHGAPPDPRARQKLAPAGNVVDINFKQLTGGWA